MPPVSKHNRYAAEKRRAADLFVDRETFRAAYRAAVEELLAQPGKPHLLVYHGVGGQGKTALCRKLIAESGSPRFKPFNIGCGQIDLHENPPAGPIHALVALRNALAQAMGVSFPAFDLAYADYWSRSNPEKPAFVLGATRINTFGEIGGETGADLAAGVAAKAVAIAIGAAGDLTTDVLGGAPFLGQTLKRLAKWTIQTTSAALIKAHAPALKTVYERDYTPHPQIIIDSLPDILAHELALHQRRKPGLPKPVIFIDEYENALPHGGGQGPAFSTTWDATLREFISACANGSHQPPFQTGCYRYDVSALFVILGREKLRWPEIDAGWAPDLKGRQHLLGGLSPPDAGRFLEEAGVREAPLRSAMISAASVTDPDGQPAAFPVLLDLGVQIYFDTLALGRTPSVEDFTLTAKGFDARRNQLFARFMRSYQDLPGLEALLRRLSCLRYFDAGIIHKLCLDFQLGFNTLEIDSLLSLSFITPIPQFGAHTMARFVAETLASTVNDPDRVATLNSAIGVYDSRFEDTPHGMNRVEAVFAYGQTEICRALAGKGSWGWPQNVSIRLIDVLGDALGEALDIRRRAQPPDHPDIAQSLNNIGLVHYERRAFDDALAAHLEALDIRRRALPRDHPDIAASLNNIGIVHCQRRVFDDALAAHLEALDIRRRALPPDHPDIATSLSNIGVVHDERRAFDDALAAHRDALDIRRRTLPPDHPDIAASLNNIGIVHSQQRAFDDALAAHLEALAIRRRALPPDHPHIAASLNNIGIVHGQRDAFNDALVAHREALDIRRRALPPDHPDIAESLNNIGVVHGQRGAFDGALATHLEALDIRCRALPPDHPDIANSLNNIGIVHGQRGAFDDAHAAWLEALDIRRRTLPPDHPDIVDLERKIRLIEFLRRS